MTRRYDALLLDFYGTLVVEDDHIVDRILHAFQQQSAFPCTRSEIGLAWNFVARCEASHGRGFYLQRDIERDSLVELTATFGAPLDAHAMAQELFDNWSKPDMHEDVPAFLDAVDLPICIVSNIDRCDIEAAMAHHGWSFEEWDTLQGATAACRPCWTQVSGTPKAARWSFDHIVTSECCRSYKPRPEMFERALAKLNLPRERVLHVGDSWASDVVGATRCGIDVAWINRKSKQPPAETEGRSTFVIDRLTALVDLL